MSKVVEVEALGRVSEGIVLQEFSGMRLDRAASLLFGESRSSLQKLVEGGRVFVNGLVQKNRSIVHVGDVVSVHFLDNEPVHVVPEPMSFDILYEDAHLFVINKPAGLVVHPAPGNRSGTFVNGFVAHCSGLECDDPIRPGIVHRLDKDTSGVLIAAKTSAALQAVSRLFHDRLVKKEYLAIVCGRFEGCVTVDLPIGRDCVHRKRMSVVERGRAAVTRVCSLEVGEGVTAVCAVPFTGRTHQIRVHLRSLGHPIVGDVVYGRGGKSWGVSRQMLHCASISFTHPMSGEECLFCAPVPGDMCHFGFRCMDDHGVRV